MWRRACNHHQLLASAKKGTRAPSAARGDSAGKAGTAQLRNAARHTDPCLLPQDTWRPLRGEDSAWQTSRGPPLSTQTPPLLPRPLQLAQTTELPADKAITKAFYVYKKERGGGGLTSLHWGGGNIDSCSFCPLTLQGFCASGGWKRFSFSGLLDAICEKSRNMSW